jgi:MFS family permease
MLGQIIFSHLCSKFKFKEMQIFLLISLSCLIQAIFVGLAVFSNSKLIVSALVLIGGGFVAAATYPLCIHISESHMLKKGPIFQRQLFLALALCADLGQLVGGLLLSLVGKFTQNGQFALSIPIVIVLFITFSYFFKSEREVTNV